MWIRNIKDFEAVIEAIVEVCETQDCGERCEGFPIGPDKKDTECLWEYLNTHFPDVVFCEKKGEY